jgi:hypothetical protein
MELLHGCTQPGAEPCNGTVTTGKIFFAVWEKNTAKAFRNTAKPLLCASTRRRIHGENQDGKDLCRVYFWPEHGEDIAVCF